MTARICTWYMRENCSDAFVNLLKPAKISLSSCTHINSIAVFSECLFPHLGNVRVLKLNLCYSDMLKVVPPINLAYFCLRPICISCAFLGLIGLSIGNLWELRKMTLCDMHWKYFCLWFFDFMMLHLCKDLFLCRHIL